MLSRTTAALAASVCLGLVFAGCGQSANYPSTAPVEGKVMLDGNPVAGANITLRPVNEGADAHGARAVSGDDGTFTVRTFFSASQDVEGAVPGTYQVSVTKTEQTETGPTSHDAAGMPTGVGAGHRAAPPSRSVLPEKYGIPQTSGLEIEVKAGERNQLPLELTSD